MSDDMESQEYFLALRSTTEAVKFATGLRVSDLAQTINRNAAGLRAIIILDCCYAGAAARYFQSGDPVAEPSSKIPFGLTLFAASPSRQEASIPPGGKRTMFSDCLLDVLCSGIAEKGPLLSIRDISDRVRLLIEERYRGDAVRPEIHSPRQRHGDVADYPLFPNLAFSAGPKLGDVDAVPEIQSAAPVPRQEPPLALFVADEGLVELPGIAVLSCAVIESPESVRRAVENTRRLLINSAVLDLGVEVKERLQKDGFDYRQDDSDVRATFIETIAPLTYEAYSCAADISYFKDAPEQRIFCELFGRLLFDRISKHKSERIEIFLKNERAGLLEVLEGVVSSCVHRINSSGRGQVRYEPTINMIKPRDGCIELAKYVAAVVAQRLDQRKSAAKERRDYRRIESKVRLIRRLDTGQFFSRHHPLRD